MENEMETVVRYYDPEYNKEVTEEYIGRQYNWFREFGYRNTYEQYKEDNFYVFTTDEELVQYKQDFEMGEILMGTSRKKTIEIVREYLTVLSGRTTGCDLVAQQRLENLVSFSPANWQVKVTLETLIQEHRTAIEAQDYKLQSVLEEVINFMLDCC